MKNKETIIKTQLIDLLQSNSSEYHQILKLSNELSKYDPKFQRFSIDAKTLIHLGRDSIKDHTTALIELVKNSYDADAKNVEIEILCKSNDLIRVADNGFGMTKEELLNSWLRIGFSSKRNSKLSQLKRRKTGEKGIGRISTDRLGSRLELITKTKEDGLIGLRLNWDDFDTEGKDVFDIDVEIFSPEGINIPNSDGGKSETGTEIRITRLRQTWTSTNIENLFYELSTLTPPFQEVKDFEIILHNDIIETFSKKINASFYKAAEIELTAIYGGKGSEIMYSIKDKYNDEIIENINWPQLITKIYREDIPNEINENLSLGPLEIKLLFFLREASSVQNTEFRLKDLRIFLDYNVGIKIYRDNFAVKPYGFPSSQFGFDWLELGDRKSRNPAGIGRGEGYMVNPNQLIGAIFITRDSNPNLTDSAAREGLVESEAFAELKALVMGSILMLESHRAKTYSLREAEKQRKETTNAHKEIDKIKKQLLFLKDGLNQIKSIKILNVDIIKDPIEKSINDINSISLQVDATMNELLNSQRVLSGLATMGISSAVFGHEIEVAISSTKNSVTAAKLALTKKTLDINGALNELDKAIKNSKKVAAWGAYALTRVQSEKRIRRIIPVKKTIQSVIRELNPAFEAVSIKIEVDGENIFSKTYQMDIESILVNLLTNSYTACLQVTEREIRVKIAAEDYNNIEGYSIKISDSGPGIAKAFAHRIFEPLFSTKNKGANKSKSVGTGLGLNIVQSIVEELKGTISFDQDPILKGARFKIWLPKEI